MSSQEYRNQEYEDQIQFLIRKVAEIESLLNQAYEDDYEVNDL